MKKVFFVIVLLAGVYASARVHYHWSRPNSDSLSRVSFAIPKGSSVKKVAAILEDRELIQDAWTFALYSRWHDGAGKIQAGEYVIPRNLTYEEIFEIIQTGKSSEMKVTIPEGSTIKQIDEILARKNLSIKGEFEKCTNSCDFPFRIPSLEGYLLSSTYFVNPNTFTVKSFIKRLYDNFKIQLSKFDSGISASGRTEEEIIIVASMIEREAFGDSLEEKKLISGIIWKRLDERIHLGIDATTRYELNDWKRPLYTEDFQVDSPYNTRRTLGLPPTAISNPSIASVEAAVYPKESRYYYYLHDRTGKIRFAEDNAGHVRNKEKYLY